MENNNAVQNRYFSKLISNVLRQFMTTKLLVVLNKDDLSKPFQNLWS